jgi:hypothetical protein
MAKGGASFPHHRNDHRHVMRLLHECADVRDRYEELIATYAVKRDVPTREVWQNHWCDVVRAIADTIAEGSLSDPEVDKFLSWNDEWEGKALLHVGPQRRDNIFRYPNDDPKVHIHIGSIHSIKGETHTATLVFETFWKAHNLDKLRPWITGDRKGGTSSDGVEQRYRLKVHYVAMTRPTHLLCLAMKRSTFETKQGTLDQDVVDALRQRGWQVKLVCQTEPLASGHGGT